MLTTIRVLVILGALCAPIKFCSTTSITPYVKEGALNENISLVLNGSVQYIISYPDFASKYPYRVSMFSPDANPHYPIIALTSQQSEATSWELPLRVQTSDGTVLFHNISRILCDSDIDPLIENGTKAEKAKDYYALMKRHNQLTVSVSTYSPSSAHVYVKVSEEVDFYLQENKTYFTTISPSQPRYYFFNNYSFSPEDDRTVLLDIDSADDTCLSVSIQSPPCPVFDLDADISRNDLFETIDTRGGIIIKKNQFPNGFFVIFVAKANHFDCDMKKSTIPVQRNGIRLQRTLSTHRCSSCVHFKISPTVSKEEFVSELWLTFILITIVLVCVGALSCLFLYVAIRRNRAPEAAPALLEEEEEEDDAEEPFVGPPQYEEFDRMLRNEDLRLSDLATKDARHFQKESINYLCHVVTVSLFYGIPVVQLVVTHQRIMGVTGDLDICYYNFLCAYPYSIFNDYNHVYSNIGYICAGFVFIIITALRDWRLTHVQGYGIPKHYGLFYSMGMALCMEGVLSMCYHICPNQANFQFDTSFMYVMAILCLVKLYQNRHPDINARAYIVFVIVGVALLFVVFGIMNGNIAIWIIFIILYIVLVIIVCLKVYFIGMPFRGLMSLWYALRYYGFIKGWKPVRKMRICGIALFLVVNLLLPFFGIYCFHNNIDFGTYLLILLLTNVSLYILIYFVSKIYYKERISIQSAIYLILSAITWPIAGKYFFRHSTEWMLPAALSRHYNTRCVLGIYDYHDLWHFVSAGALFCNFMLLLTIDDELIYVPHRDIHIF